MDLCNYVSVKSHYDSLIDEDNDPARDPKIARDYMDRWDGQAFIDLLELTARKSVLEIGVGTGRLAQKVCGSCKSFCGIDLSEKTISRAKENLSRFMDISDISLVCDDFLICNFNSRFDIIYSSLTFMHIEDKQSAVEKTASLLNPGGRLIISLAKSRDGYIDMGTRKVIVFPDDPDNISKLMTGAGLLLNSQLETEFAFILAAVKL